MSNLLSEFKSWCNTHAPQALDEHDFFEHNNLICIANAESLAVKESIHRPCHHIGLPIATKKNKLLPAAIDIIGEHLPEIHVNEQAARVASYGKDILATSIEHGSADHEALVAVVYGKHRIAIGQMIADSDRAVRILVDIGRFLHKK